MMARAELIEDLRGMLSGAADKFYQAGDNDHERHLRVAAADLMRVKPRILQAELSLVAGQSSYVAPADLVTIHSFLWGREQRQQIPAWHARWPGPMPVLVAQVDTLVMMPAPTAMQISLCGSMAAYSYVARYLIGDQAADTTVPECWRELLLIRAMAQALTELANSGFVKPVSLGERGVGAMPKNGTAASLSMAAMDLFERMAAA